MGTRWVTLPESLVTVTARAGLRRAAAGRALPGGLAMSLRCRQFPALSIDPCEVLREAGASIGAKPWAAARPKASPGRRMQDPASGAGGQSGERSRCDATAEVLDTRPASTDTPLGTKRARVGDTQRHDAWPWETPTKPLRACQVPAACRLGTSLSQTARWTVSRLLAVTDGDVKQATG